MRRSSREDAFALVIGDGDVARSESAITANIVVELWCAVVLPEIAENAAQCVRASDLGCVRVVAGADLLAQFERVRRAELVWGKATSLADDGLGGAAFVRDGVRPEIPGAEYLGDRRPRACFFGWASSFCSASN
jgi:hypothetical protein